MSAREQATMGQLSFIHQPPLRSGKKNRGKTMKHCILLAFLFSLPTWAQEAGGEMEAMMKHMTPGPVHAAIAQAAGKWKTQTTLWMAPGAPPSTSEGTCVNEMILGGRYQRGTYTGTIMGMPFEGEGLLGYDNTKKQLQTTWADSMGTSIAFMRGDYDEKTKTFTFKGKMTNPMGGPDMEVRSVTRTESEDRMVMEMFMLMGDQEIKTMEIVHTRVK